MLLGRRPCTAAHAAGRVLADPRPFWRALSSIPRRRAAPPAGMPCMRRRLSTEATEVRDDLRNIAIIAHVDHGKTTLVDALIQDTDYKTMNTVVGKDDRIMDSNDQERERGITILAKNASVTYNGTKINIVDTPGHADFGGEVERVLNMVDGVLLVVDAQEGPKPQTRFVLGKALSMGRKVLVVVNKVDKPAARPDFVVDKTFDLFCDLGASDEQTDFNVIFTSALQRLSGTDYNKLEPGMAPLLDAILAMPKPRLNVWQPLRLQISNVGSDSYIGRLGVGRITSGAIEPKTTIGLSAGPGCPVEKVKLTELFVFNTTGRKAVERAAAGDIVVFAGIDRFNIGDTLVDLDNPMPLPPIEVEKPTMSITMAANSSPFKGKSGSNLLTSRQIKDRLLKELETNVALRVDMETEHIQVFGRGLLHLTVLIENMRREGFEMMVGPPMVLEKEERGKRLEPVELVDITVPEEYVGSVIDTLNNRKGTMLDMGSPGSDGMVSLQYEVTTRALVGVKSKLLNLSRGEVIMTATFAGYKDYVGDLGGRERGSLLASEQGVATAYGLEKASSRGDLFSKPGDNVYENQIVGVHAYKGDLKVNICRQKHLTNIRAASKDDAIQLAPPKELTLETAVEYVLGDEFVEVTPDAIRMLKPENKIDRSKKQL